MSDGLTVGVTGIDGACDLTPDADAEFVFVTVPGGHEALDGFWLDVRGGAPDLHRFELRARPGGPPERFRFLHVTDLHVSVDGGAALRALQQSTLRPPQGVQVTGAVSPAELEADLAEIVRRERPDFVAATGDLADFGRPEELRAWRRLAGALPVPVAHVPGNHDVLSCMDDAAIEAFATWWLEEGMHEPGADAPSAFAARVFGGDWRRAGSGRRPWLDEVGPAYFSFDWGAVHVVVYDSEGLHRYGADYPQDRWLAADLARVPPGTPVVALLHFPEPAWFFERFAGVDLVATFAGHWHADRVLRWHGCIHHATPTLGFGGIDHSPRAYRVVDVDGDGVTARLAFLDAGEPVVPGVPPVVDGTEVTVRERADGTAEVLGRDAASGEERWQLALETAVKHQAAAAGDLAVVVGVTGLVVALDGATGEIRWERQLGDPWRRWCYAGAAAAGDVVVAGAASFVAGLDALTGAPRWVRDDLAPDDWLVTRSTPVVVDGLVVAAFAGRHLHLCALDLGTGTTRWTTRGEELAAPWSDPVPAGDAVVVTTVDGWLRCVELTDGAERWRVALDGAWPLTPPVVDGDAVRAVGPGGTALTVGLHDGAVRGTEQVDPPPLPRPYGRPDRFSA